MSDPAEFSKAMRDVFSAHGAFRPPKRVSVSEGAANTLIIKQTGGTSAPWSAEETPYMVQAIDLLASRRHDAVCFVGPARCGKTEGLITGWMAHAVVNDPGDMAVIHMAQEKAREFSRTTIDRALRNSPLLAELKSNSAHADNTFDKSFKHGMWLKIAWPTVSNLSGSTYRYVALTDYDRMPDDIGGEGAAFPLALKRTQTFLSRGMCMVESSPGRDIVDPAWVPATAHEAPPVSGVLGIYNNSDRRRWYWKCLDCAEWFEAAPGVGLFGLPAENELLEVVRTENLDKMAAHYARIICPHCGSLHGPERKKILNANGRWLRDGQSLTRDDEVVGVGLTSTTAGFWLGGVAAAFQPWRSILVRHLQGLRQYALSGSEETLKNAMNVDQGVPYLSRHLAEMKETASDPQDRPNKDLQRYVVPDWTRLVVASVDVQGGTNARFDVQVHAVGVHHEQALINRFDIRDSRREGMGSTYAPIDPASYPEDWDRITEEVVRSTYRTSTEGKEIRVKLTVVDSGGEDGVTDKAYEWMRRMRRAGLAMRVMLYKGASTKSAPLIRESLLGNRNSKEKGDVPVYVCNPNLLADAVAANLKRTNPGPGYYHFPEPKGPNNPDGWLSKSFFDELAAEVRDENGTWRQVRKRNESFDHCKMIYAALLRLGVDKIKDWNEGAPQWAQPLDSNSEVVTTEQRREMKREAEEEAKARVVEARTPIRRPRRAIHSPYLGG
ncbi:MAG: terminase gpA endonuclease subunit [Microbacteriaceae bacterium]